MQLIPPGIEAWVKFQVAKCFQLWEHLDHKEGWVLKNWCFWTVVLEKTLESPLEGKGIKTSQS